MTTRDGFSRTIIPFPEGEYMRRWIFQCRWFTVRLHNIKLPDEYRPHNHPWNFVSILLKGQYMEYISEPGPAETRVTRGVYRRRLVPAFRGKDTFHRVVPAGSAWTLVITGPKRQTADGDAKWGFMDEAGNLVDWRQDALTESQRATYGHETPEV